MNKDERSAASTGADTERHRSNDLNPASAPALSLPIQRLGSAMEGLAQQLRAEALDIFDGPETAQAVRDVIEWFTGSIEALRQRPDPHAQQYLWLEERRDHAMRELKIAKDESTRQTRLQDIDTFDRAMRDLGDEVAVKAAFRQRPGAQAASEPTGCHYPCCDCVVKLDGSWTGCKRATPAGARPAQAEPMTESWQVSYDDGRSWIDWTRKPNPERDAGLAMARVRRVAILASPSSRERPSAQPAPASVQYDGLYEYAQHHRLDFNELCRVVRNATAAVPQRNEGGA